MARRHTLALNRDSDFGLHVPLDADQSTFVMAADAHGSPSRILIEDDGGIPSAFEDLGPELSLQGIEEAEEGDGDEEEEDEEDENEAETEAPLEATADARHNETDLEVGGSDVQKSRKRKRGVKMSRHGIEYPSLPPAVIKRLAQAFAQTSGVSKTKISPDTLAAITQASDWFFEQLGDDLQAYAKHAGRKTIDESDIMTLLGRLVYFFLLSFFF
jgi:histone H3/H4